MKKPISTLLLILIFTLAFSGCSKNKPKEKPASADDKLNKIVNDYVKRKNFSGTILIGKEGKVLYKKAFGMADYEKKIPNTVETQFPIWSSSKQFTAAAIMLLVEQGKLSTEDTLSKFIPDFKQGDKIKIHNLLTHSSGIDDYDPQANFPTVDDYHSPESIINLIKSSPLSSEPGTTFKYTNANYFLLGYIIEKVSNMKYEDFVNENLFKPSNMNNTLYNVKNIQTNTSKGYTAILRDSVPLRSSSVHPSIYFSAAGIYSTVEDLYKWDQALYGEKILKKSSLDKMFTHYTSYDYGYGWFVNKKDSSLSMYCMGCGFGHNSYFYRNTNDKVAVIILCNDSSYTNENFPVNDVLKALK